MELLPFERVKRELLVKVKDLTNPALGCKPENRSLVENLNYGVICVNKPTGPTSHQVADYLKKILNVHKIGHGGTLDPNVTGVLPVALGKGTRIVQTLLPAGKEYICLMHLHDEIDEKIIKKILNDQVGIITQLPPLRSAVKRQERQREIYYLSILEIEGQEVLFKVGCQGGTYIRKLVHDAALQMGTRGHMVQLVRTKAGPFTDKEWYSLHDILDAFEMYKQGDDSKLKEIIKPVEHSIRHLNKVYIFDTAVDSLCHGADLHLPGISKLNNHIKNNELVAVMTLKDELVCLGLAKMNSLEMMKEKRGLAVKCTKVFMEVGVYEI